MTDGHILCAEFISKQMLMTGEGTMIIYPEACTHQLQMLRIRESHEYKNVLVMEA